MGFCRQSALSGRYFIHTPLIPLSNRFIFRPRVIFCLRGGRKGRGADAPLGRPGDDSLERGEKEEGPTPFLDSLAMIIL
jgi:hypothetical protein